MNRRIATLTEYISEATAACLVTMVQGNLLALTLGHLAIASQTGIIAGAVAAIAILASRTRARWIISAILGVITAVVDFLVHPGQFGPVAMEAVVTGLGAALISYLFGTAIQFIRGKRAATD